MKRLVVFDLKKDQHYPLVGSADFHLMYEKYVKDRFIWHVFSWELIKPEGLLVGDAARRAYNEAVKTECIFCDMYNNGGVTDKLSPQYETAEKIDEDMTELYVVAKDYSWTYIKTHECDLCGPYFLRDPQQNTPF